MAGVWRGVVVAAIAVAVLAACGSLDPDAEMQSNPTTTTTTTTTAPPTTTIPPVTVATRAALPADCSTESVNDAVSRGVESEGLRSDLLTCDGRWMAVLTYTQPCPANGEAAPRCRGNEHIVYFGVRSEGWTVLGFDQCDDVRAREPEMPEAICVRD
jgi:hypothetical protein